MDTPDYNRVHRVTGHYNLLDLSQESAQYIFRLRSDAPKLRSRSLIVDLEYDDEVDQESPLSVAQSILDIYRNHYLFNSRVNEARALVEYLSKHERSDRKASLQLLVRRLRKDLLDAEEELSELQDEQSGAVGSQS